MATAPMAMSTATMTDTANQDGMSHNMSNGMSGNTAHGKMAIEKLISSLPVTHTAVRNGPWSDPKTWAGGRVPGKGANVLIGKNIRVTYDKISEENLGTIAIRGKLQFATGRNTKLRVETIINAPEGRIDIGSQSRSVAANRSARIIFTSDRAVNTQWDPEQLSKGLISHGSVNIYGAEKQDKVRLSGNAAAGDDTLTFKDDLTGWRVGDKIVLAGTSYRYNKSDKTNDRFRDEVLTIREINGRTIKFTNENATTEAEKTTLRFDHKKHSQLDANKIDLYAANLKRNVSFETENGKNVSLDRRAHVMLMHNPNVKVLNAGFYDLGRSDKTKIVDDIGKNVDGSNGSGTNIRGRYSLHLHQTGLDPKKPVLLKGNAISGSPGWGIAQHESHAGLEDNVVFDVAGAGIVAESGNEIGWWKDNISIKTTGIRWDKARDQRDNRERKFDLGFEGDGYWIQGAARIKNDDNIAISANHTGMSLFSGSLEIEDDFRPVETIAVKDLPEEMRSLFPGLTEVDIRHIPMATVSGFEGYNSTYGLEVWGHSTNFDGELAFSEPHVEGKTPTAHLGRSLVKDFKTWGNLWGGASVQYSSNVDLKNGIVAGVDDDTRVSGGRGVFVNHGTYDSVVDGVEVTGFKEGIHFEQLPSDKNYNTNTLRNSKVTNSTYNLSKVTDETLDNGRKDDFGAFVRINNNQFEQKSGNRAPVARFKSKGIGGLSVALDASASSDPDPYIAGDGTPKPIASKGIAAYGWDINNDGKIDYFGRTLKHTFDRAGSRTVGLSVLDAQGQVATTQQTINVQPTDYGNAFKGGNFAPGVATTEKSWMSNTQWADKGWFVSPNGAQITDGVARLSKQGKWGNHIGQVVRNERVHKGNQTLSFRLQNVEGSSEREFWKNNEVVVTLWGANGQFDNSGWEPTGPQKVGALPMRRTQLIRQTYGGEQGEFFDWKNISLDADLGNGYEYLLFQVNVTDSGDVGDRISIDNVSLASKATAATASVSLNASAANAAMTPQQPAGLSPSIELGFDEASGTVATKTAAADVQANTRPETEAIRVSSEQGKAANLEANLAVDNDTVLLQGSLNQQRTALMLEGKEPIADGVLSAYLNGESGNSMSGAQLLGQQASGIGTSTDISNDANGGIGNIDGDGLSGLVGQGNLFGDAQSMQQRRTVMA